MATATKLTAFLNIDAAQFESGLKKARKSFANFGDKVKVGAKATGAAVGLVTAALGALAIRQAGVIDETAKLSAALGVNVREFQALALVAGESGISQDQLGNAITRSQRAINEASRGIKTYSRAFETLGLDTQELLKLRPDEQFQRIAGALSEIENPTIRTATALEIFGRSGRQVNNILNNFQENLTEAREFNDRFNVSLTAIDASKVEEANDSFARIGTAISGVGNTIAVELSPFVTAASKALLDAGIDGKFFGDAVKSGVSVAGKAIDILRQAIIGLRALFNQVVISIGDNVAQLSLVIFEFGENLSSILSKIPGVALEAEDAILNVGLSAKLAANKAREGLDNLTDQAAKFETTAKKIENIQKAADQRARERLKITEEQAAAVRDLTSASEEAAKASEKIGKKTKENKEEMNDFEKASDTAFDTFLDGVSRGENALDSLKNSAIAALRQILESIADNGSINTGSSGGIGSIFNSDFGGIFDDLFNIDPFPSFATGSRFIPRDTIARVHQGEAIIPASQVRSMKNNSGGGPVYNIDARGASPGVSEEIRNVLIEVDRLRSDVPDLAINSVVDANKRNNRLLRT